MVAPKSHFKVLLGTLVAIDEFISDKLIQPVFLFLACKTT